MTEKQKRTSKWLNRAFEAKVKLNSLITQRDTLRTLVQCVAVGQSGNDTPASVNANNNTKNALIGLADIERDIISEIRALVQAYTEINATISKVEDTVLQAVLRYRYLSFMTIKEISSVMHYNRTTIMLKHKQALDKISLLM